MMHTNFLNVDLDLHSDQPLDDFIAAWGDTVHVLHHGTSEDGWLLSLEVVRADCLTVEATLQGFFRCIERLPPALSRRFAELKGRTFDIGIQAGEQPTRWHSACSPATLATLAALDAQLVITVYAPYVDDPPAP